MKRVIAACLATLCWSCGADRLREARDRLAHRTDHQALLAACRDVLANRGTYRANPETHGGTEESIKKTYPDPRDPAIPLIIQALGTREVIVQDDYVQLIVYPGGFHNIEIVGFREGADEGLWSARLGKGGRRLAPGLWYYEDVGE